MKKRDSGFIDLKTAFRPTPDACREALSGAVRSVKEEQQVKQASKRTLILVLALVLFAATVAIAASQLGLKDMLKEHYGASIPVSAQTALSGTEQKAYAVGPVTITLRETLCDGRILYGTAQPALTDGKDALLLMSNVYSPGDILQSSDAKRLGVAEGSTCAQAAKTASLPLYVVSFYLQPDPAYTSGDQMLDQLWAEDGETLLIDLHTSLNPDSIPAALECSLYLRVQEVNPDTGEMIEGNDWTLTEPLTVPVSGVTAEKTYKPGEGEAHIGIYTVKEVFAEQTCAGAYLTITLLMDDGYTADDYWDHKNFILTDSQDKPFDIGMSLSGEMDDSAWPIMTLKAMIGAEELPGELRITLGDEMITLH